MENNYVIKLEKFEFKDLVDILMEKYRGEEKNRYDKNAIEPFEELSSEEIRKKTKNKDGNIGRIIDRFKGNSDEKDLNIVRYMLYVLEQELSGSLKIFFDEKKSFPKFLNEEDEDTICKYNLALTAFRKALEIYIQDLNMVTTIKESIFETKKQIEITGLLKTNYYLYGDYKLHNEYEEIKKYCELFKFMTFSNVENLTYSIYENLYFYLLKLEAINNINVSIDTIDNIINSDYSKKILKKEKKITINEFVNKKIKNEELLQYLNKNIRDIIYSIDNEIEINEKIKKKILQLKPQIIMFNNCIYDFSLMQYMEGYNGKEEKKGIYEVSIVPIINEILLEENNSNEYVKNSNIQYIYTRKTKSSKQTVKSILKKDLKTLTFQEKQYLKLRFNRSFLYYSGNGGKWETYLDILKKNFENGKDIYSISENSIRLRISMSEFLSKYLDEK